MNRSFLVGGAVGLAIGLFVAIISYQVGKAGRLTRAPEPIVAAPIADEPAAPQVPPGLPEDLAELLRRVQANPKDRAAWITLGNAFFDANQPEPAIQAYERALQLEPNDPDVITDQGVMYVALRKYDKALANFQKANKLDPNHRQSLFNMGVAYDGLDDPERAEEVWKKVIASAPDSPDAARAREMIEELRARRKRPKP